MTDKLREKVISGSNKTQFLCISYWLIHMNARFGGYSEGSHIDRGLRQGCVKFCFCSIQLKPSGNLDIYIITGSYYLDWFPKANFDSVRFSKLYTEQNNYYTWGLVQAKSLKCKAFCLGFQSAWVSIQTAVALEKAFPEAASAPLQTGSRKEAWEEFSPFTQVLDWK